MFRYGDIVLEMLRNGRVFLCNKAIDCKTVGNTLRIDNDPDTIEIVNILKGLVLAAHLVVDRKKMLGTTIHRNLEALFFKIRLDGDDHFAQIVNPLSPARANLLQQKVMHFGINKFERKVFKLNLHLSKTEPVRQRSIDISCFKSNLHTTVLRKRFKRSHVMQPVAELYENNPNILHHRQQHLAKAFSLGRFPVDHDAGNLGKPFYNFGHFNTKFSYNIFKCVAAILNNIMQERRRNGYIIKRKLIKQNSGNFDRMVEKRLPRSPFFPLMCPIAHKKSPLNQRFIEVFKIPA